MLHVATNKKSLGFFPSMFCPCPFSLSKTRVFYCFMHDHSSMAVAAIGIPVFTFFDIPANIELGVFLCPNSLQEPKKASKRFSKLALKINMKECKAFTAF